MSKEIKIGLIGAGWMGKAHTTAFHNARMIFGDDMPVFELVSDVSEDAVAKFAKNMGYNRYTTNWMDVVTDPEIDLVDVATPNCMHYEMAKAALEHGKHVFCEKPLATTLEDAKKVVEAEKASGKRLLQIGFMRRFDPDYIKMKKILDSGELGAPLMAHCISRTRSHPKNHTTEQHITNIAIHEIDICRWLLGENLNEVAVRFPRATCFAEGTCQDPQLVLMQSDSGVLIDVEVSGNSYYGYEILCELVCEKGTIRLPVAAEPIVRSYLQCGQAIPEDWTNRFVVAYQEELQHWVDYLQSKTDVPGPGAEDGYEACKISDALIKAQTTGQWEKVEA